jgi:glyoxylase-like metal-dependent hydrolase (beta-lactamase superfamily II)
MLGWRIGEVTVTRVVEMEVAVAYDPANPFIPPATPDVLKAIPWLSPHFIDAAGAIKISIHALLVDAPGLKLVVDTCMGNDKPRSLLQGQPLQTKFLEEIAAAGFAREAVNAVVCTHLHVDHVGWNTMLQDGQWVPTFPNARYLMGRIEYEHWRTEPPSPEHMDQAIVMADSVAPVIDAGLAQFVEADHRLSPEVRLVPTPGHTPGHVSVLIESKGESAVITGDMMHHPVQIARPSWSASFDVDPAAAAATREAMVRDWSRSGLLVIGTHFAGPTAGRVKRDGEFYRLEV